MGWHFYAPYEVLVRKVHAEHTDNPRFSGPAAKKRQKRSAASSTALPDDDDGIPADDSGPHRARARGGRRRGAPPIRRGSVGRGHGGVRPEPKPAISRDDVRSDREAVRVCDRGRGGRSRGRGRRVP